MKTVLFLFKVKESECAVLPGQEAPWEGSVWTASSVPGYICGNGRTKDQAIGNLKKALESAFKRAGGPEEWYEKTAKTMTESEADDLQKWAPKVFTHLVDEWLFPYSVIEAERQQNEVGC